jgi:cell division protein FtsQ
LEISLSQVVAKLLLVMTVTGLIVSAVFFIGWLYKSENFPIRKVELINKLENQESIELQKVSEKALHGGFFNLDVELFRTELLAELAWVKSVTVRKIWPDKLLVSIDEHEPVVRWLSITKRTPSGRQHQQEKYFDLLSREGIIFSPHFTDEQQLEFSKMALLTGPYNNAKKILKVCYQINKMVRQLDVTIAKCGMNERRAWSVVLGNGIELKLGKDKIMQQLERFTRIFSGQLKHYVGSIDYADLRYSNGFSIKWNPVNTSQIKEHVN